MTNTEGQKPSSSGGQSLSLSEEAQQVVPRVERITYDVTYA